MSLLIPDNNVLLQFVPNVLKSVQGETLLFDKIAPHLEVAEAWLTTTFLSEAVLAKLPHEDATNKLLHYARMAVAAEAMLHVVPQLDLVLTPNGFGVVSNTNIAPASKERVERLLLSLEKMRDDTLAVLLPLLTQEARWATSDPCQYWSQTLYPWLDLPRKLGSTDHSWQQYQVIHEKQVAIEERLAHDFFSCELLATLRQAELLSKWGETSSAPHYKRAWRHIFAIELYMLREEGDVPIPSCIEVVNSLRNAPDGIFEEWKQSETAALFENHGYKNDKRKGGYWF